MELLGIFANLKKQVAVQEAAVAGIKSMEHIIQISNQRETSDFVVSRFKKTIPIGNRTGHARFRRTPAQFQLQNPESDQHVTLSLFSGASDPAAEAAQPFTVDFFKGSACNFGENKSEETCKAEASTSGNSSSAFASTITGEGSVSNGKSLLSALISAGKPPLSGKRCRGHDSSDNCHCKKRCVHLV